MQHLGRQWWQQPRKRRRPPQWTRTSDCAPRQAVVATAPADADSSVDLSRPKITEAVKKGVYPFMKFAFHTSEISAKSDFFYAFFDHFDIGHFEDPNAKLGEQVRLWTDKKINLQRKAYNALKELRHNAKHGVKTVITSKCQKG